VPRLRSSPAMAAIRSVTPL